MRNLHFKVSAQVLERDGDFSNIVSGTEGYLVATFDFPDEWSGCVKIARFFTRTGEEHAVRIVNNQCKIPNEVLVDKVFKLKLVGQKSGYTITTNAIIIKQEG